MHSLLVLTPSGRRVDAALRAVLFMILRFFDKSYAVGGKFFAKLAESARPAFAAPTAAAPLINANMFVLVSMLASAFLAHYNAPKFYNELEAPADGGSTPTKNTGTVAATAYTHGPSVDSTLCTVLCSTISHHIGLYRTV